MKVGARRCNRSQLAASFFQIIRSELSDKNSKERCEDAFSKVSKATY